MTVLIIQSGLAAVGEDGFYDFTAESIGANVSASQPVIGNEHATAQYSRLTFGAKDFLS